MSPSMLSLQSELRTLRQPDWSPRESAGFTAQMCGSLGQHSLWEFCLTACLTASSTDTPSKRRPMSFGRCPRHLLVHVRASPLLFAVRECEPGVLRSGHSGPRPENAPLRYWDMDAGV